MSSTQKIQCQGLKCPIPIVKVAQKFKELKIGDILEITADDEAFEEDIKAWVEATGQELVSMEGDELKIVLIKKIKEGEAV